MQPLLGGLSIVQVADAIVNRDILLYRASYFLPDGKLNRYYLLRLDEKKIQVTESKFYKKNVRIIDKNGDWGEWEIDYQGYYCVEYVPFYGRVEFCVYSDDSGTDYFYFDGKSHELSQISVSYNSELFMETFLVRYQDKIIIRYKYFRQFWRGLFSEPPFEGDEIYPLRYIVDLINQRAWKRDRKYKQER